MSDISSLLSSEVDIVDREILFLITKGNPSPYGVWAAMNRQMQGRGLAYVNIKKRIKRMEGMNILKRVEPDIDTATAVRLRKEYKLTAKGIEQMTTYILTHYEEVPRVIDYMNKFGMDKIPFGDSLMDRAYDTLRSVTIFVKNMNDNPETAARYVVKAEDQLLSLRKEIDSLLELKKARPKPKLTTVSVMDSIPSSDSVKKKAIPAAEAEQPIVSKTSKHSKKESSP
jgi:hypothetical protein